MSDNIERGICIASFDSGGPGTISQLSFLKDLMSRLEYDLDLEEGTLLPADYFDIFGGVGWGIVSGVLLGLLRMTPDEAIDELSKIAHAVFPNEANVLATPEANMSKLRFAVEDMLERRRVRVDIKLNDKSFANSRCKVVLFAPTTETMGHCHPFRSYRSRERGAPNCSIVDAICAALANPETFVPVAIGPPKRQQMFAGTPLGFSNPIRAVLEEARIAFGNDTRVALILSLGSGQSSPFSFRSTMSPIPCGNFMNLLPRLVEDCERVAKEMARQLAEVEAYLRFSVEKGLEDPKSSDWHRLGAIISHTDVYMQSLPIPTQINRAVELLRSHSGSVTLGELGRANAVVAAKAQYQRQDCNLSLQIQDIARKVDRIVMEKITFVDSVGNRVPIPMELCCSYKMLTKIIQTYFDHHQRLPRSRYVKRNKYQLVQGNDRSTIIPVQWDYSAIPGGTIEMSILVNSDKSGRLCPRCNTEPQSWRENEWVTCQYCQKQFKAIQNENIDSDIMPTLSPESNSRPLYPREEIEGTQPSQEEIEENFDDEIKKIRLISAIYKELHLSPLITEANTSSSRVMFKASTSPVIPPFPRISQRRKLNQGVSTRPWHWQAPDSDSEDKATQVGAKEVTMATSSSPIPWPKLTNNLAKTASSPVIGSFIHITNLTTTASSPIINSYKINKKITKAAKASVKIVAFAPMPELISDTIRPGHPAE